VVLEFWATWCAPCQKSIADLQDLADKNPTWKDKVVLIAASVDEDRDALIKHLKAKGWTRTHNVQVRPEAIRAYHVGGIPTAYVIDRLGRIVAAGDIPVAKIVSGLLQAGASAESVPPR
jgi:thiol-disulfide isomerase/thioredoxin